MGRKHFRFFRVISIILGLFFLLNYKVNFTGAVIGIQIFSQGFSFILGLVFVLAGIVLFMGARIPIGELETLLVEEGGGKNKVIKFVDPTGLIMKETKRHPCSETAAVTLGRLRTQFGNPELKPSMQEFFQGEGYIEMAYNQRDTSPSVEGETIGRYADEFLKEWAVNYRNFIPPTNPLLIYDPARYKRHINPNQGVYLTRDILPVIKENIEDFDYKNIPLGDVPVSYPGARFNFFASHAGETKRDEILRKINRMAEEDVNTKRIHESEIGKRREVLKRIIFG